MDFNTHKQFFTNESLLALLGQPSGLLDHDRYVHKQTPSETKYINEVALRIKADAIENRNNEWLRGIK